ncbi:MAG: Gfo/Idh/MocA family oxidoreductase [candidate division Zixibacteria bacterium]|nr:Gfo/Idh/MocA family oxidoreductase [candidate division Zixibacteria bacterium]
MDKRQFEPLRVAVAGCGNISGGYGRRLTTRPELVRIVGAFDVDGEKAKTFTEAFGGKVYTDLDVLLGASDVEAVINLTSHHAHTDVSARSMQAGKHVHSEKPLAGNREDGKRLLDLSRRHGVRLSCSPFTFLGEGQQTVWKALRDGLIGEVRLVYAEMNWNWIEAWHPNPEGFYAKGAGPLLDVGVYPLTFLTTVLGPVKRVSGMGGVLKEERVVEQGPLSGRTFRVTTPDHVVAGLEFESGAFGRVTASFYAASHQTGVEFHGDGGALFTTTPHDFDGTITVRQGRQGEWQTLPFLKTPFRGVEWGRAVFELALCLRTAAPQRVTGDQAFHVLDICHGVIESIEQGGPRPVHSRFDPPQPYEYAH